MMTSALRRVAVTVAATAMALGVSMGPANAAVTRSAAEPIQNTSWNELSWNEVSWNELSWNGLSWTGVDWES